FYDINGNGKPDDWISGTGTTHTCLQLCSQDPPACSDRVQPAQGEITCRCSADEHLFCEKSSGYLERIIEADPEHDPRGIQGWTSLGFSGPAEIRFMDQPQINRTKPERPHRFIDWPEDKPWFDDPSWYHRKGRVYLWWHEGDGYSREFIREQ